MRILTTLLAICSLGLTIHAQDHSGELLKVSENEIDFSRNGETNLELLEHRKEFSEITSIKDWSNVKTTEINYSTEGGTATIYKDDSGIRKIIARHYGETYQALREYYFNNNELFFLIEKTLHYNRPIYYGEAEKKANNDDQAFNPLLSTLKEFRHYFSDGALIHQVDMQDTYAKFDNDYLEEEGYRIKDGLNSILNDLDEASQHKGRSLIGVWQSAPVVGSGWGDNYQFFEDGTFNFNHNQMACDDSVIMESGTYRIGDQSIKLFITSRIVIKGGTLEPSSGSCASEYQLTGGTETKQIIERVEEFKLKFVAPFFDYDYLERIELDEMSWFRMLHDPNEY